LETVILSSLSLLCAITAQGGAAACTEMLSSTIRMILALHEIASWVQEPLYAKDVSVLIKETWPNSQEIKPPVGLMDLGFRF
jgi:hypothetical protein